MATEGLNDPSARSRSHNDPNRHTDRYGRSRIKLRAADRGLVLAVGALTGVALILVGLRPTGALPVDVFLSVAASMFIVWAGCTAPWQVLTVCATMACAIAPQWIGTAAGLALIVATALVGLRGGTQPAIRAAIVGATLTLLGAAGSVGPLGFSALVGFVVATTLTVTSLQRRPRADRKIALRISLGVGLLGALAVVGLAMALVGARNGISVGSNETTAGLTALRSGDVTGAVESLNRAEAAFASADRSANAPWGQLARFVPVAAQYRFTATSLTSSAHSVAGVGADSLRSVDPQSLRLVNGKIDVDAVMAMREPVVQLQDAVEGFTQALVNVRSVWLPATVDVQLDELASDLDRQQQLGTTLIDWIDLAPEILGADGKRTYFVMFTTPAEARGQGGFMGNFAEMTIDHGAISMTKFGRTSDLNFGLPDDYVMKDAPPDWLARFGRYGFFNGDKGTVGNQAWGIIDMSAHFPNTAKVISELYPASGGTPLDGVISLDVYGIQALVGLVGPIDVPGAPQFNGDNTAEYLLLGQYLPVNESDDNAQRIDMLEEVASATLERLLSTNPPDPVALGKAVAPLAQQGRVLVWSKNDAVEAMLEKANLDGRVLDADALAESPSGVGLQLVVNNGAGSKIDSFLKIQKRFDAATQTVTYDYTNTAPSSGYNKTIIGSVLPDIPMGTSVLLATLYSSVPVEDIKLNGLSVLTGSTTEGDRYAYEFTMILAAGATSQVEVVLPPGVTEPALIDQPLRQPVPG